MTWVVIAGAALCCVASYCAGFAHASAVLWRSLRGLWAAASAKASQKPAESAPVLTQDQLETRAMTVMTHLLQPLERDRALRVLNAGSLRFLVAPAIAAAKEEDQRKEEQMRERQLLFVASQAQLGKVS